jgi:hypothetical protein
MERAFAGTEQRRFVVGALLLPLIGWYFLQDYQDWFDSRQRMRETSALMLTDASNLAVSLDELGHFGAASEELFFRTALVEPKIAAVRQPLASIAGLSSALLERSLRRRSSWRPAEFLWGSSGEADRLTMLVAMETSCSAAVDGYVDCLHGTRSEQRVSGNTQCTDHYRLERGSPGSCDDLVSGVFKLGL